MANWQKGYEKYRGKRVLVLGAARSGIAAARLLLKLGAEVTLNDRNPPKPEDTWVQELETQGAEVILGGHPERLLTQSFDLIVKNPGIPYTHPYIRQAAESRIPVITEVEVGFSIFEGFCIAITGSNGKTTTTTLVGEMLAEAGFPTVVAGNIGRVFCEQAVNTRPDTFTVLELSSFQLKGTETFRPRIACLLNLYEHHLDYHGSMEDYLASKKRIFRNQNPTDFAVLNWDQDVLRSIGAELPSQVVPFSRTRILDHGAYLDTLEMDGRKRQWLVFRRSGQDPVPILPRDEIALPGEGNLENALASVAIAMLAGVAPEVIARALRTFAGVEHRLEFVAEKAGVRYYNDSKATNPEATEKALLSFEQPIILIAGGMDRGSDFSPLIPLFRKRVKALVTYGETREQLALIGETAGVQSIVRVNHVGEAVLEAAKLAAAGDVVLLSPACASWDLYSSFEERGRIFKEAVHKL